MIQEELAGILGIEQQDGELEDGEVFRSLFRR